MSVPGPESLSSETSTRARGWLSGQLAVRATASSLKHCNMCSGPCSVDPLAMATPRVLVSLTLRGERVWPAKLHGYGQLARSFQPVL